MTRNFLVSQWKRQRGTTIFAEQTRAPISPTPPFWFMTSSWRDITVALGQLAASLGWVLLQTSSRVWSQVEQLAAGDSAPRSVCSVLWTWNIIPFVLNYYRLFILPLLALSAVRSSHNDFGFFLKYARFYFFPVTSFALKINCLHCYKYCANE